jgi:hypothetical protein
VTPAKPAVEVKATPSETKAPADQPAPVKKVVRTPKPAPSDETAPAPKPAPSDEAAPAPKPVRVKKAVPAEAEPPVAPVPAQP